MSIHIKPRAVYEGAVNGRHAALDPDSYRGYITQILWLLRRSGEPVMLRAWWPSKTKPEDSIFQDGDPRAALASIGREDLLDKTVEDYEIAVFEAINSICENKTLRRFWMDGVSVTAGEPFPRLLDVDVNDPRADWLDNKGRITDARLMVWVQEIELDGFDRNLLVLYSPADLEGTVTVGEYVLPVKRRAYFLTNPVQEIEIMTEVVAREVQNILFGSE